MKKFTLVVTLMLFVKSLLIAQTAKEVTITQWSAKEENGYIKIIGEVKNTYQNALGFVKIEIEYYDKQGKPISVDRFTHKDAGTMEKDETTADLEVILPGETSPFSRIRDVGKLKGEFGSCKLKADGMLFKENLPFSATLSNVSVTPDGQNFTVKGTYKAMGSQACKNPAIIMVGYDENGKIIKSEKFNFTVGNDKYKFVNSLEPNQTYEFSAKFLTDKKDKIKQVKALPFYSGYF